MNTIKKFLFTVLTLSFIQSVYSQPPTNLTTDLLEHTDRIFLDGYLTNMPLSEINTAIERYQIARVRNPHPYLGWVVNSETPNTLQVAYRILIASSKDKLEKNEADMWDSGKIESNNSISIRYNGVDLSPATVYYWKVKTWDNRGTESKFSEVKSFMTAPILDGITSTYPLQITDEYPVKINPAGKQCSFVDFGKAAFGKLRLTLVSENGEDTVIIRLGEKSKDGRVDQKPGGSIRYTEYRLPLSAGIHTYSIKFRPDERNTRRKANESGIDPVFMPNYIGEVYPFRYCEIDNYAHTLTDRDVLRQSAHYPFNDRSVSFHSSDSVLNQVWDLCKYSIKATSFIGTYVDGDRERIAYEADALINQLCHYAVDREFSMARQSHEYLLHHPTWPTEWNLQSVLMAWNDYIYTGNKTSLEQYYEDLKAKTLMELKENNGLISTRTGKMTTEFYQSIHFKGKSLRDIVDWPQSGIIGNEKSEAGEADGYVLTDYNTVVNAYHYEAVRLMGMIAGVLEKKNDQQFYTAEAEKIKKQFNKFLFDSKKGYYKDGVETEHHSLHANMFPLAFGMVPDKYKKSVFEFIRSRKMACSVYGSQFLLDAVYNMHEADYGLQLLTSMKERSWYNMIRVGSTITLEAWDNKYKPNLDWNHAWGAAPANLIPRKLMGIEPLEAGFGRIRIKPQPGSLHEASIKTSSIRGDIKVSFVNNPRKDFSMQVEIPANTSAEIWLPLIGKGNKLEVDGRIQKGTVSDDFVIVNVGSGKHVLYIMSNIGALRGVK